jgi:hypothetical protein
MYEIENLVFGIGRGDRRIKDEIQILRKNEEDTFIMDQTPKKAQWNEIIILCEKYLRQSKDLYILNRMCEAITALYGIHGFSLSLDMISKFFIDSKSYYPSEEDMRENYLKWINNRLCGYIYKNADVEKILSKKEEVLPEQIEMLRECLEKGKSFFFHSETFDKTVLQLISDLQPSQQVHS